MQDDGRGPLHCSPACTHTRTPLTHQHHPYNTHNRTYAYTHTRARAHVLPGTQQLPPLACRRSSPSCYPPRPSCSPRASCCPPPSCCRRPSCYPQTHRRHRSQSCRRGAWNSHKFENPTPRAADEEHAQIRRKLDDTLAAPPPPPSSPPPTCPATCHVTPMGREQ